MRKANLILLALVAIHLLAGPLASGQGGNQPRGLYIYSYPAFIRSGEYESALSVEGIDGAAVVMKWAEIEPARGVYDFSEFDRRIKLVRSHGLAIELGVLAGGSAPEWIYLPSSKDKGARKLSFVFSHHNGKGRLINVTLAPPWDPIYQAAFVEMLGHVAQHLRAIDALKYVSVVKLTGVNTDTDEVRLPAETPQETGNPGVSDAISTWRSVGYRPSLVVQAMREVAMAWARAFPDTWMVLPIIPQASFPPIGEDGQVATGRRAKIAVRDLLGDVVAAAEGVCHGHFLLQMDWLMAGKPVRPRVMELARRFGVPVAWQTNFYLGREGKGAACGGEFGQAMRCNDASFLSLLEAGIHPEGGSGPNARGAFIEVFPPDAIEFAGAIARAHDEMVR
ncbi:MAG TPA: beta-galactosidase [archaeon]|nr:beta-galactosidase [archaeon]